MTEDRNNYVRYGVHILSLKRKTNKYLTKGDLKS